VLFTKPALYSIAVLIVVGLGAFAYLIIGRYGTPFVVSKRVGLGALVFLLGRFAVVAVHETAHGLTMASFGRRIERAGIKLIGIFPYAFVDTSEAWFEPRRRRIAVSLAGPIADFTVGGAFAIGCVLYPLPMLLVPFATGSHAAVLAFLLGESVGVTFGVMVLDISANAIMLAATPDGLRARMAGAFQLVNYGVRPLGALAGGALGATIGIRPTLLLAVAGALASVLWLLPTPVPRLRELPEAG
jgi:hypothetical protein